MRHYVDRRGLVVRAGPFEGLEFVTGSVFLPVAMIGAIWLATGVIFGDAVTAFAAGGVAAVFAVLWYVMPLARLQRQ